MKGSPTADDISASAAKLKIYVQAMLGPDDELSRSLENAALSTLGDLPSKTYNLWNRSTVSPPVLTRADRCWSSRSPNYEDVFTAAMQCLKDTRSPRVFSRGEATGRPEDWAKAVLQLLRPDANNPISIIGLTPDLAKENNFMIPQELSSTVTAYQECNVAYNLTPKHSVVDIHIDHGNDGLSAPLHECVKIWVLYPPSEQNLQLMQTVEGQKAKLISLAASLEGGLIVLTTSVHAIYLPAGCIHGTFTFIGGFLVTKDFTSMGSTMAFSRYLALNLHSCLTKQGKTVCFRWYLDCLDVALSNGKAAQALEAWIRAEVQIQAFVVEKPSLGKAFRQAWKKYFVTGNIWHTRCPCGWKGKKERYRMHLEDQHLAFLQ